MGDFMKSGTMMDTRWMRWSLAALTVLVMSVGVAVLAGATERSPDEVSRITRDVSEGVFSPFCPGQTLAMCPSANAAEVRREIQEMARQGREAEDIKAELIDRYGDGFALVEPPASDQWTLFGGILGGLAVAALAVGVMARRRLTSEGSDDEDDDGDADKPDDEELYLEELRAEYRD